MTLIEGLICKREVYCAITGETILPPSVEVTCYQILLQETCHFLHCSADTITRLLQDTEQMYGKGREGPVRGSTH